MWESQYDMVYDILSTANHSTAQNSTAQHSIRGLRTLIMLMLPCLLASTFPFAMLQLSSPHPVGIAQSPVILPAIGHHGALS